MYLLTCAFALIVSEVIAFLALRFVVLPRNTSLFYRVPTVSRADFENYLTARDPLLGWPAPRLGRTGVATVEPRPVPAFPTPGKECVSLYGDSFTYGSEVSDSEAWSNVLSTKLNCRVANFGVGGYGTDQAYLRFLRNSDDNSELAILGIFPGDIMRNVNQYLYFLDGDSDSVFSLKPRFIIEGNQLTLISVPRLKYEEFLLAIRNPELFFKHEAFLPNSAYGPVALSFPYTLRLVKLILSDRIVNVVRGRPSWVSFLMNEHPSRALGVTAEIAEHFTESCRMMGKKSFVLIFPTARAFISFKRSGSIATQPLTDILKMRGIRHLELYQAFAERLGDRSFCELVTDPATCTGHFNGEGNKIVADVVSGYIVREHLLGH